MGHDGPVESRPMNWLLILIIYRRLVISVLGLVDYNMFHLGNLL